MSIMERPLSGLRVGLSVSGTGEELARRGFTEEGLNRLTVRLARALLAEGAALAFGHDWREGGVMEAVANIALDYQRTSVAAEIGSPIVNLVPWPDTASETDSALLSRLKGIVEVIPAGLPEELGPLEAHALQSGRSSEEWRYLRARGLTHLRRLLAGRSHARVALGGKLAGSDGRLPGIVEEAFLSLAARQPVYLAGILGGAAEALGKNLLGEELAEALRRALKDAAQSSLVEIYSRHAAPSASGLADSDLNVEAILGFLAAESSRDCIRTNGLTRAENLVLLNTSLEEEAVSLILRGLKQKWNPRAHNFQSLIPKPQDASAS
jgi:hypothetical protein